MSYGKMTTPIVIARQTPQRDGEGFACMHHARARINSRKSSTIYCRPVVCRAS